MNVQKSLFQTLVTTLVQGLTAAWVLAGAIVLAPAVSAQDLDATNDWQVGDTSAVLYTPKEYPWYLSAVPMGSKQDPTFGHQLINPFVWTRSYISEGGWYFIIVMHG